MDNTEITIKTDKIYDGKILSLKVDTVELPNKKYSKREIVEHSAAVSIVAITEDDEVLIIKQYRKAIEKEIYEVPAGLIEIGELPKDAAMRELTEETGYTASDIQYLSEFYTSPGFCTEKIHVFLATGLKLGEQNLDLYEFIDVEKIKFEDVLKMLDRCEINDAKTIASILYYKEFRRKDNE
ncbi:NUDIX hydrolase [Peptoniphilus indolicus]|uniref:ADP-ribose pyrophosphatase n=2 Tax=Peptoniphilus indolicus TaxID=33030 RepID=G4D6N6_9FIRM|nr:NUDIX hydrolase [Peptoniphilus indolicus]EGY76430.1 ADP-ribose pyrophosphatase [Peptoniphilus indolicus ATCC 29427]SUB76052.1 ADP-ribose pyrophosphatase [Peptoniphilus indolicus]